MARRKIEIIPGHYYHIFNRGTDKRKIVLDKKDLNVFMNLLLISNSITNIKRTLSTAEKLKLAAQSEPLVHILAYAILPNHYHLLLKEIREGGISKFMQKFGTAYAMYFNEKYKRSGTLFQGRFKATYAADTIAVSSYVNLNYVHHKINASDERVRTSLFEYIDPDSVAKKLCDPEEISMIIKACGGIEEYKKTSKQWSEIFVRNHEDKKDFNL